MSDWTADIRAKALIAECAADLPELKPHSGFGLGGWETSFHYSNRDPRVRQLKLIRAEHVGDDPAAYFEQATIEQAIDAAAAQREFRDSAGRIVRAAETAPARLVDDAAERRAA